MSGPSGTESDETRSRRGLGTVYPTEAIAAAIDDAIWLAMGQHEPLKNDSVCTCGVRNNMDGDVLFSHRYSVVSDAANAALTKGLAALREEVSVRVGQLVGCVMSRPEAEANPAAEIVATRWVSSWRGDR